MREGDEPLSCPVDLQIKHRHVRQADFRSHVCPRFAAVDALQDADVAPGINDVWIRRIDDKAVLREIDRRTFVEPDWRNGQRVGGSELPFERAVGIDRVKLAVAGADVDRAASANGRRGCDSATGLKRPRPDVAHVWRKIGHSYHAYGREAPRRTCAVTHAAFGEVLPQLGEVCPGIINSIRQQDAIWRLQKSRIRRRKIPSVRHEFWNELVAIRETQFVDQPGGRIPERDAPNFTISSGPSEMTGRVGLLGTPA